MKKPEFGLKAVRPSFPLIKKFEENKGIFDLLNVALAVVSSYSDETQKKTWTIWLNELKSFCELPAFFNTFSADLEKS